MQRFRFCWGQCVGIIQHNKQDIILSWTKKYILSIKKKMANVILFLFGEQRSGSGKSQVDPAHGGPRETDTHQVGLLTGFSYCNHTHQTYFNPLLPKTFLSSYCTFTGRDKHTCKKKIIFHQDMVIFHFFGFLTVQLQFWTYWSERFTDNTIALDMLNTVNWEQFCNNSIPVPEIYTK